jgi:hypothetical protein
MELCARTISRIDAFQLWLLRSETGSFWLFDDVEWTRLDGQQSDHSASSTNVLACNRSHSGIECVCNARQRRLHPQAFEFVLRHDMI